jgi:dTDP-4-dehydrorhamnose 3,5-epimerase
MKATPTALPEVKIIEPKVFGDERGFFFESWNAKVFNEAVGEEVEFIQDNHSRSVRNVLRGIHYQLVKPQGKLVRVVSGKVLDVAVDLRKSSPNFGKWIAVELSDENHRQLWIPEGFGHAFVVRSEMADFLYKTTNFWYPEHDRRVRWDDPTLAIDWGLNGVKPKLAAKDAQGSQLAMAEVYA